MEKMQGIGLPFFSETEWAAAKLVMEDRHTFHDTYADFLARVEQTESRLRRQGQLTIRVHLRMAEFLPWCAARARKVNAQSRSEYAAFFAAQQDRGSGGS